MANLTEKQIGPGPVLVWDMQTASAGQIDACCGMGKGVNLLDNWYFVGGGSRQGGGQFPINQRGQTEYDVPGINVYTIDRWCSTYLNLKLQDDGLLISATNTPSFNFFQKVDNPKSLIGTTVTYSILATNVSNATLVVAVTFADGSFSSIAAKEFNAPGVHHISVTIPAETTDLYVAVFLSIGNSCNLIAAKLELGSVQTLAHQNASGNWILNDPPPDFALELVKCQRHQLVLGKSTYAPIGMFVQSVPNILGLYITTSVGMRAKPAISVHGTFRVIGPNENKAVSLTVADGGSMSDNGIIVGLVPSVAISSGVGWIDTADAQSYVLLDCNP